MRLFGHRILIWSYIFASTVEDCICVISDKLVTITYCLHPHFKYILHFWTPCMLHLRKSIPSSPLEFIFLTGCNRTKIDAVKINFCQMIFVFYLIKWNSLIPLLIQFNQASQFKMAPPINDLRHVTWELSPRGKKRTKFCCRAAQNRNKLCKFIKNQGSTDMLGLGNISSVSSIEILSRPCLYILNDFQHQTIYFSWHKYVICKK